MVSSGILASNSLVQLKCTPCQRQFKKVYESQKEILEKEQQESLQFQDKVPVGGSVEVQLSSQNRNLPPEGDKNPTTDLVDAKGEVKQRRLYGDDSKEIRDIIEQAVNYNEDRCKKSLKKPLILVEILNLDIKKKIIPYQLENKAIKDIINDIEVLFMSQSTY